MNAIQESLSLKTALFLVAPLVLLTAVAAVVVTYSQTDSFWDLAVEKAKVGARLGARFYGNTLESAIDSGQLTVQQVFDRNYVTIEGYEWGDHPKYHTQYDFFTDMAVLQLQDEFLRHPDFVFAVGQDVNGYIPTHNTRYQKPLTGRPELDLVGNRSKRIFNDEVGLAAGAHQGPEPLVQLYERDTGVTMLDVSVPILVKGKHWGAFRLNLSLERMASRARSVALLLSSVFAIFGLLVVMTIFFFVRRAMRPVEALTVAADNISTGIGLEYPIRVESNDEVGKLARAIDRLRISMKAAMGRLGE
ncbi:MAG: HAMP domain-containing protein [Myxococcales bacterium]|nr:HAMP domain-containing protein [Myxococcales bacterium]